MQRVRGFSLIELLIVVIIIGILSAIAIPAYTDYLIKGKIGEATGGLSQMRMRAEQYFADNRTYVGFPCTAPGNVKHFTFSCPTLTAGTYLLQADGTGSMTGFTYSINQANTRASSSPYATSASCWMTGKKGGC